MSETMTVKEVAERLRLCLKSVYALVEAGEIPARRIGVRRGKILIDVADVEAYWEASKVGPKLPEIKSAFRHIRPPLHARRYS